MKDNFTWSLPNRELDASSVKNLIELLQEAVNQEPKIADLPIRVIQDNPDSDDVANYWLTFLTDVEVSLTGSSGYEQSGEVRLIGRE
tara:strand:+ start:175 stop:435 length:261 start_codon:yes stop_codon:yes gene_type:complete